MPTDIEAAARIRAALDRIPRITLVDKPTPVRRLAGAFPNAEVWLKDDSSSHPVYGGNKPRKLEYLIADAKRQGKSIVTFGFESSNHAVASAFHCSGHGVPCHLVLVRGPDGMSEADRILKDKKLQIMHRYATSVRTVASYGQAARAGFWKWLSSLGRIQIVPPGGSNARGALGYVRAAVELAEQVERGDLPEPSAVYLPVGTGGTVLGLAIGLAACGLHSRVIAVKVVPGKINELPRLRRVTREVGRLVPELPAESLGLSNLTIDGSALGGGYGMPTVESLRAVEYWARWEGLKVESTYSGKAASVLARETQEHANKHGPALFWLTYSDFRG